MPSGSFMDWEKGGKGRWITTYANEGHIYAVIAGPAPRHVDDRRRRPGLEQGDALRQRLRRPASGPLLAAQETRITRTATARQNGGPCLCRGLQTGRRDRRPRVPTRSDVEHLSLPPRERLRMGLRIGIPYAVAALVLAISFGVLAEPIMGNVAPIVMSALVFAGSAQFASTAVLGAGGGALAAVIPGILLNLRYVPMGIALAPSLRGQRLAPGRPRAGDDRLLVGGREPRRRPLRPVVHARRDDSVLSRAGSAGPCIGVFAGDLIGDPAALGLDVLFPAFFLVHSGRGRAAAGAPGRGRGLGRRDRARAHPDHAGRGAGDRRLRGRAGRAAGAFASGSADDRRLGDDRRARRHDGDDPGVRARRCSAAATCIPRSRA